jgi:hypothetical protein
MTPDPLSASLDSIPGSIFVGGVQVIYYDRAYSRWLPVSRASVSPDGSHYAYTDRPDPPQDWAAHGTLHVVDVRTGRDQTFDAGAFPSYEPLDYADEGIYLMVASEGGTHGLWSLDPSQGDIKKVADLPNIQGGAGNRAFWMGSTNPADPNPMPGIAVSPDQIERYNLVDGSRQVWFYRPGAGVYLVGQDVAGHPIVAAGDWSGQTEVLMIPSPGQQHSILRGPERTLPQLQSPIADSHGIWFGSPSGIYLYTEAGGLNKVSTQPGYPANGCF